MPPRGCTATCGPSPLIDPPCQPLPHFRQTKERCFFSIISTSTALIRWLSKRTSGFAGCSGASLPSPNSATKRSSRAARHSRKFSVLLRVSPRMSIWGSVPLRWDGRKRNSKAAQNGLGANASVPDSKPIARSMSPIVGGLSWRLNTRIFLLRGHLFPPLQCNLGSRADIPPCHFEKYRPRHGLDSSNIWLFRKVSSFWDFPSGAPACFRRLE